MIPMLAFTPTTNNQRVVISDIPGDENARIFSNENAITVNERQSIMQAAYLQIFQVQKIQ